MNVKPPSLALYSFTLRGLELGLRLAGELGGTLHAPQSLRQRALAAWSRADANGCAFGASTEGKDRSPGASADESGRSSGASGEENGRSSGASAGANRRRLSTHGEDSLDGIVWFTDLRSLLDGRFTAFQAHIFIAATGIAVRAIAPHLQHKGVDPGVVVLDQLGQFAISLLSGHLGGANALTLRVAALLGAVPVITTATEGLGLPAVDVLARERGLVIANPVAVKHVSAALIEGRAVDIFDPHDCLGLAGPVGGALLRPLPAKPEGWEERDGDGCPGALQDAQSTGPEKMCPPCSLFSALLSPPPFPAGRGSGPTILVTARSFPGAPEANCLIVHPPVLYLGVGCKRGTSAEELHEALEGLLESRALARACLAGLASFTGKGDEPGLLTWAAKLQLPLTLFTAGELAAYPVCSPSPKALAEFGIRGVCEPAALACAARQGRAYALAVPKTVFKGVTLALAVALPAALRALSVSGGRRQQK